MKGYIFQSRVAYDDVDCNLHLTQSGVMRQMQETAILDSDRSGYSVNNMEEKGVAWILIEWRIEMIGTGKWNDKISIETWPRYMNKLTSIRDFIVTGPNGETIALGESLWVLVDIHTGHPIKLTKEVTDCYQIIDKKVFQKPMKKLLPQESKLAYVYKVEHRDIDTNHHMNNRVYPEIAREALPEELKDTEFPKMTVRYHEQLLEGDKVQCYYRYQEGAHVVDICKEGPKKRINATVAFYEEVSDELLEK